METIKKPTNQREEVLAHLKENGNISSMSAIKLYGITRLAAKIHELRDEGFNITTTLIKFTNRYQNKSTYGVYKLVDEG